MHPISVLEITKNEVDESSMCHRTYQSTSVGLGKDEFYKSTPVEQKKRGRKTVRHKLQSLSPSLAKIATICESLVIENKKLIFENLL